MTTGPASILPTLTFMLSACGYAACIWFRWFRQPAQAFMLAPRAS